jgi:hypothetical protein
MARSSRSKLVDQKYIDYWRQQTAKQAEGQQQPLNKPGKPCGKLPAASARSLGQTVLWFLGLWCEVGLPQTQILIWLSIKSLPNGTLKPLPGRMTSVLDGLI